MPRLKALSEAAKKFSKNKPIVSYQHFIDNFIPPNFYGYSLKSKIFVNSGKRWGMSDHTLYFPKSSGARFSRYSAHFFPSSL
jgi:hypothetical protein